MFFIRVMGRRSRSIAAQDLEELGEKVTKAMASEANDAIVVSVGKTDQAVMPYVWIRRNSETDDWEGTLGDSIRLGIEDGLLTEHDPIQVLSLENAVKAGFAEVADDGPVRVVSINTEPKIDPFKMQCGYFDSNGKWVHDPKHGQVGYEPTTLERSKSKLTNEEKAIEAKRMTDELLRSLHEEEE